MGVGGDRMNRKLIFLGLIPLLIALYAGCGAGQVTESTDSADEAVVAGPPGPQGPQGPAGEDGDDGADGADGADGVGLNVPAGVWLDGVNRVMFYSSAGGLMIQAEDTTGVPNDAGAFNGGGIGNKAFVGLHDYDGMLVSDISSIKITARQSRGTSYFYLNLQVDCDGNGVWDASDGIVVADFTTVAGLTLTDTFASTTILPTDAAFKMVGGPKASCGNLPSHGGVVGVPLTDLPATAVLWNGSTGDGGMPRDTDMASVLFVMGDSTTEQQRTMTLQSVSINGDEYVFGQ
jgi:hypothetical protein